MICSMHATRAETLASTAVNLAPNPKMQVSLMANLMVH